ncbi:hypothetical protein V6N13_008026 [Hibiscus sabdariffa]
MGHGVGEGGVEKGEVFGERERRGSKEGMEETDHIGLRPDLLEFERTRNEEIELKDEIVGAENIMLISYWNCATSLAYAPP